MAVIDVDCPSVNEVPVPLAKVFQPLKVWLLRLKEFGVRLTFAPDAETCSVELPAAPFGSNVCLTFVVVED